MARVRSKAQSATSGGTGVTAEHQATAAVHAALACLFAGLAAFAVAAPDAFREAMQEDALAEWATFWLFLIAGAAALVACARLTRTAGASNGTQPLVIAFGAIGLFCLFVAGEEISWGQRLLGFRPPAVFLEHNIQQELNLHNLIMEVVRTRVLVAAIALGYGVLLPLLARARRASGRWPWPWVRAAAPAAGLWPWFLFIALAELSYPVSYAGEAAELGLGAVLLADVWLRVGPLGLVRARTSPLAVVAVALAVLVCSRATMVVSSVAAAAGDEALVVRAEVDLDRLSDDLATGDAIQPSLLQAGGMHVRIFSAVQKRHLRFPSGGRFLAATPEESGTETPVSLRNRQTYFLDPWHNSYWLYANRRAGYMLLYSMGPNRRRDTPITTLIPPELRDAAMSGDDIGIAIELGPGR